MIRKFFAIAIFFATIMIASFGQHIVGREHIRLWAHQVQEQGPERLQTAWQTTDKALAALATQAGSEQLYHCTYSDLAWAQGFYNRQMSL